MHFLKFTIILTLTMHSSSLLIGQSVDFRNAHYEKADSIAKLYPKYSLYDIKGLAEALTKSFIDEEEKFRAIYTWVCLNIENDYILFLENKRMRHKLKDPSELKAWNKDFTSRVMRTLLKDQRTVCTGYAYLIRELCIYAGLRCEIVDGHGRTIKSNIGDEIDVNHSWNAVRINNKWYLCDATWSSGNINPQTKRFVKNYNDCYFLTDPAVFVRNHYPLDTAWILLKNKPSLASFLNRPIIYASAFNYGMNVISPDTLQLTTHKGNSLTFQFEVSNNVKFETAEIMLTQGTQLYTVYLNPILKGKDDFYSVEHTFTQRGNYVMRIVVNNDYLISYKVQVL